MGAYIRQALYEANSYLGYFIGEELSMGANTPVKCQCGAVVPEKYITDYGSACIHCCEEL